ncbi:DUF4166 domain-containing protein [Rickettsia canadensis]|uniref:DUF4166 domain-containing protein n=1 Tax=Rickettsia canadensis str. CA410 TaxID=1105107 RepID=A0ABN4AGP9_RICCA|nr:DUF4166 domain-containing protein [Rickettsia canadensis]AFB21170.1 hypothetical protein RCA_03015 [Rickettsia canadensis str. CA410]
MICKNLIEKLPIILQKRYNIKPYSNNKITLEGKMNITISKIFQCFSLFCRAVWDLTSYPDNNIPVAVILTSDKTSPIILMHRIFYYKNRAAYHFYSKMILIKDNIILELIRFRIAIKLLYHLENNKIIMDYGRYVLYLGKSLIPIPLHLIIGKFFTYKEIENDKIFNIRVKMVHTLFSKIFEYTGKFKIEAL